MARSSFVRWSLGIAGLFVSLVCGGPSCSGVPVEPEPDAPSEPVSEGLSIEEGGAIVYELEHSWEGAVWDEERAAYLFETDLGYTVGLEAGYLGAASIQLVPCEEETTEQAALDRVKAFFSPRLAFADHAYENDVSLVGEPFVESLLAPGAQRFGVATSGGSRYCQVHQIVAPLLQPAEDGFEMVGTSVYLRGFYRLKNEDAEHPFEAEVNLGRGTLRDLEPEDPMIAEEPLLDANGDRADARVVLRRFPARAFDGVVFEELSEKELAYEFLVGLGKTAVARYQLP